jgi:hypothetical protein
MIPIVGNGYTTLTFTVVRHPVSLDRVKVFLHFPHPITVKLTPRIY